MLIILTPLLLLGIVALLGFVGCATIIGIEDPIVVTAPTMPTFTPASKTKLAPNDTVRIEDDDAEATVYYTTDMTVPSAIDKFLRNLYTGPLQPKRDLFGNGEESVVLVAQAANRAGFGIPAVAEYFKNR